LKKRSKKLFAPALANQIDDMIKDAVSERPLARLPTGEGETHCVETLTWLDIYT
jgi:hypothetical protein